MYNRSGFVGFLGKDPELKESKARQEGRAKDENDGFFTTFSVGVSEKEETLWVNVVVFGRQAKSCKEYLTKGSKVLIEGKIGLDQWEQAGEKRSALKLTANNVVFLDSKKDRPASTGTATNATAAVATGGTTISDDDIPF